MPQWIDHFKSRISIAAFFMQNKGQIAGRLHWDPHHRPSLTDVTGTLPLSELQIQGFDWIKGIPAWVCLEFPDRDANPTCTFYQPIQVQPATNRIAHRFPLLLRRFNLIQAIRNFFLEREFLETDTPTRVACPGMEPFLDAFPVEDLYLRTSPELHMKQLLAAGFDRIFQIAPCFRAGDRGRNHREEFLMLEWYRAFADLHHIARDLSDLLTQLAPLAANPDFFRQPVAHTTCAELFDAYLGLKLQNTTDCAPLHRCADLHQVHVQQDDDWDTLYFRLFLTKIEPHLGQDAPLIVTDYPASQAALAKMGDHEPGTLPFCHRLELYVKGIELANAFYELTDPNEHRRRFHHEQEIRRSLGKPVYPVDPSFMAAIDQGLPPSAGIALGVDRLLMVLLGGQALDDILPFPEADPHQVT